MESKIFAAILLIGLLAACGQQAQIAPTGQQAPSGQVTAPSGNVLEVNMTARQWEFVPDTIRAHQGDLVRIHLHSEDVAHGIAFEGLGESVKVPAGGDATLEFVADKSGEFGFYCNVFCGEGHREMRGRLIVE